MVKARAISATMYHVSLCEQQHCLRHSLHARVGIGFDQMVQLRLIPVQISGFSF